MINLCKWPIISSIDHFEKNSLLEKLEAFDGVENICNRAFPRTVNDVQGALNFLNNCLNELMVAPLGDGDEYQIQNLEGFNSLNDREREKVQMRIDEYNSGRRRAFHGHIGVGGVWTMDLSNFQGGGRGDARLQFLEGGRMRLVDHDNKSLL